MSSGLALAGEDALGSIETRLPIVLKGIQEVRGPSLFGELIIAVTFPDPGFGRNGKQDVPSARAHDYDGAVHFPDSVVHAVSRVMSIPAQDRSPQRYPSCALGQTVVPSSAHMGTGHRVIVLASALAMFVASLALFPFLGGEFIPILNEAAITPQTIRHPSISLEESIDIEKKMQRAVMEFSEVRMVVSKIGRSELGNDPQDRMPVIRS